ncbi:MAG: precorrin-2 C(20)-methyltransferase [Planctomycetota bacterium]|jgi:precorrin-2/cobalt-factor-2 C20-methyltransferase|nr:precorrin-2 C(20)-methyltransferase [Planctomycetota bacterium]
MIKGRLYGVGVGPGDPELVTLKAAACLRRCPVIAAPRTPGGGMRALTIAAGAVDLSGKTILPLDLAMGGDAAARARRHREAADRLRPFLDAGPVALATLGDVAVYASFRPLADLLEPEGYPVEMIPGVTSFSAAAAALGVSLAEGDTPLHLLPGPVGDGEAPLPGRGTRVYLKPGRRLPEFLRRLRERGGPGRTLLAQNCGWPDQRLYRSIPGDGEFPADAYLSLVIVREGG